MQMDLQNSIVEFCIIVFHLYSNEAETWRRKKIVLAPELLHPDWCYFLKDEVMKYESCSIAVLLLLQHKQCEGEYFSLPLTALFVFSHERLVPINGHFF